MHRQAVRRGDGFGRLPGAEQGAGIDGVQPLAGQPAAGPPRLFESFFGQPRIGPPSLQTRRAGGIVPRRPVPKQIEPATIRGRAGGEGRRKDEGGRRKQDLVFS